MPTYVSAQNIGCPINTWQISSVNNAVAAPTGLNNPVFISTDNVVAPTTVADHASYVFYTKITASDGLSTAYFGPYTLRIGCTADTVVFADSGSFIAAHTRFVGQTLT